MPHLDAALGMLRDRLAESGVSSSSTVGAGRLFERMVLAALRDHPGEYGPDPRQGQVRLLPWTGETWWPTSTGRCTVLVSHLAGFEVTTEGVHD